MDLTDLVSSQLHDPVFFSMLGADGSLQLTIVRELSRTVGARNIFDADMSCLDMPENALTRCEHLQTVGTRWFSGSRIDSDVGLELVVVERGENGGGWQQEKKRTSMRIPFDRALE